jgi:hypothetical protein
VDYHQAGDAAGRWIAEHGRYPTAAGVGIPSDRAADQADYQAALWLGQVDGCSAQALSFTCHGRRPTHGSDRGLGYRETRPAPRLRGPNWQCRWCNCW